MKKFLKGSIVVVAMVVACCLTGNSNAYAETIYWVGGDMKDWNEASNWDTGTVPTYEDDVIVKASSCDADGPCTIYIRDDVSVNSVAFEEDNTSSSASLDIQAGTGYAMTIMNSAKNLSFSANTIVKAGGDDVSFEKVNFGTHSTLDLNGKLVTLNGFNFSSVDSTITGNGTLNLEDTINSGMDNSIWSASSYTGTTNVNTIIKMMGYDVFGESVVNINDGGELAISTFRVSGDEATLDNKIIINGQADFAIFLVYVTQDRLAIPNIELNYDASIVGVHYGVTVDLAGIKTNGHCLRLYTTVDKSTDNFEDQFLNYPTICTDNSDDSNSASGADKTNSSSNLPGVPNTAVAVLANPITYLVAGSLALIAILVTNRKKSVGRK